MVIKTTTPYCATLILTILACILIGCRMDPNHDFIQGNWYFIHQRNKPVYHTPGEDIEYWSFSNGTYYTRSCCLHLDEESGRYNIIASTEDSITLSLFPKSGVQFSEDYQVFIKINQVDKTLQINNHGPFYPGYPN